MIMKRIFIIIVLTLFTYNYTNAQKQKELARFYVTHAEQNGEDITPWASSEQIFSVFYEQDGILYLANYCQKSKTQSWGATWGHETQQIPETSENYQTSILYFNWNYQNSYDTRRGTCKAKLTMVAKPKGVVTYLHFITEDLDEIEYVGYMDGTLNF